MFMSSKIVTHSPKRSSQTLLPGSKTVVKRVRSDGVIPKENIIVYIGKQFDFRSIGMLIDEVTLQGVEITPHRSVIVRTARTAHSLSDIMSRAVILELLRGILRTLAAVQNYAGFQYPWVLSYCF